MKALAVIVVVLAVLIVGCQTIPIRVPSNSLEIEDFYFMNKDREPIYKINRGDSFAAFIKLNNADHNNIVDLSVILTITLPNGSTETMTMSYHQNDPSLPIELFSVLTAPYDYPLGLYKFVILVQDLIEGSSDTAEAEITFIYSV